MSAPPSGFAWTDMLGFSDIMGSRSEQDGCCSKGPPGLLHLYEGADGRNV